MQKEKLNRGKNLGFYETLLTELRLEVKYNYKSYLRMASENFETFQLLKDITKENTKMRNPSPFKL